MSLSVQERITWSYLRPHPLPDNLKGMAVYCANLPGPAAVLAASTGATAAAEWQQEAAAGAKPAPLPATSCSTESHLPASGAVTGHNAVAAAEGTACASGTQGLQDIFAGANTEGGGLQAAPATVAGPANPAQQVHSGAGTAQPRASCAGTPNGSHHDTLTPDIDSAFNQAGERIRPVFKRLDGVECKPAGAWRVVGHSDAITAQKAAMRRYHSSNGAVEMQRQPWAKRAVSAPSGLVVRFTPAQHVAGACSNVAAADGGGAGVSSQMEAQRVGQVAGAGVVGNGGSPDQVESFEAPACLAGMRLGSSSSRADGEARVGTAAMQQNMQQQEEGVLQKGAADASEHARSSRSMGASGGGWVSRLRSFLSSNA